MKVVTNEPLIARRKRAANILAPIAMVMLLVGFVLNILSLNDETINPTYFYGMLGLLAGGFVLSTISSSLVNRWIKEPRADQALTETLRGFDNKHVLFNYTTVVPHVVVAYNRIYVVTTKNVDGKVSVKNDRWKRSFSFMRFLRFFAEEGLGHPTIESEHHAQTLKNMLKDNLPEAVAEEDGIPIEGLIVFTSPKVELTVEGSRVPVMHLKQLKGHIRQNTKGAPLKSTMRKKLLETLDLKPEDEKKSK